MYSQNATVMIIIKVGVCQLQLFKFLHVYTASFQPSATLGEGLSTHVTTIQRFKIGVEFTRKSGPANPRR